MAAPSAVVMQVKPGVVWMECQSLSCLTICRWAKLHQLSAMSWLYSYTRIERAASTPLADITCAWAKLLTSFLASAPMHLMRRTRPWPPLRLLRAATLSTPRNWVPRWRPPFLPLVLEPLHRLLRQIARAPAGWPLGPTPLCQVVLLGGLSLAW
jgi:hypothetical protein